MIFFGFDMKKRKKNRKSEPQELRKYNVRQIAYNIHCAAEREEILDSMLTEYALYAISVITPSHLIF